MSRKRHIAKTITWRVLGTITTFLIGWITTGNITAGLSIGGFDFFIKIILYYLHERAWYRTRYGLSEVPKTNKN